MRKAICFSMALVFVLALRVSGQQQTANKTEPTESKPRALTVDGVIAMVQAQLSDEVIIKQLREENKSFVLAPEEVARLKQANVSEAVLKVMSAPTSKVVQARLLNSVPPVYPQVAATQVVQGDVKLNLTVNEGGNVTLAKVLSGPPLLRSAAADATRQWRYAPETLDGTAIATHVIVTVHFEPK